MTDLRTKLSLPPLLSALIPPTELTEAETAALLSLQAIIDRDIAPSAAEHDGAGRYPTKAIAALKRSGILKTAVPERFGGLGASNRFSMEVQVRLAVADSAVAQIFKIHDELTREILVYCPDNLLSGFVSAIVDDDAILGLAVAENGRQADSPMSTVAVAGPDGSLSITGQKIYTTGAAEADYIAVWAFDPEAGAEDPRLGLRLGLVPPSSPGVTVHRDWDSLGQRATDSGTVSFQQVAVPAHRHVNVPGRAPITHGPLRYQAGFAAILTGLGIAALAAAQPFVVGQSRPWPSAGVEHAGLDPIVRRLTGELAADLAAAHSLSIAAGGRLDQFERGEISRTELAIPIYAAKSVATRAGLRATAEIFQLMGTRSAKRQLGFDRHWRNARTLSLHDPVDWKHVEIGDHVLNGWEPPWGIYT